MAFIDEFRLKRYVEEVVEGRLKDSFDNDDSLWGFNFNKIVEEGRNEAKLEFGDNEQLIKMYTKDYVIGFYIGCLGILFKLVEKGDITVEKAAERAEMTPLEFNGVQIGLSHHSTSDVLTNYVGMLEDMELIAFGVLKAHAMLVTDGLISAEDAASRLKMEVKELERIIVQGIDMNAYYNHS